MSALPGKTSRAAIALLVASSWCYVDFETLPIKRRPDYPPKPVGVAIKWGNSRAKYYAFAHPHGGNTHTEAEAKAALREVWRSGLPVCFHNAKFDLDVATLAWRFPALEAHRVHDTQLMLFISDPRAESFKLKPSAARILGHKPEERDALIEWLVKHQPVPGVRLVETEKPKRSKRAKTSTGLAYAGAYTAYAPVKLVAPYACGDVDRTKDLADHLIRDLRAREMLKAYDVERFLLEPIRKMEADGVPVDLKRLRRDVTLYREAMAKVEALLEKKTGVSTLLPTGTCRWDSPQALLKALKGARLVNVRKLKRTEPSANAPMGKESSAKDSLAAAVTDRVVLAILKYRSRLAVSLRTFMEPWLAVAERSKGRIFTTWNTTWTDDHGARTGRASSTPNFQNMTKRKVYLFGTAAEGSKAAPAWWVKLGLPDLPMVREYIVTPPGFRIVDRDYSQQELRIFTHYVGGELLEAYLEDNWFDIHALIKERVDALMGAAVERDVVKRIVFAVLYGMGKPGVARLSSEYGIPGPTLIEIADAVKKAVPGLIDINRRIRERCEAGEAIRTWGGRLYFVEPPKIVNGRRRTFEYKMLNLLIQGSAADNTKRAVLNFWSMIRTAHKDWKILLTVHDEIVLLVPTRDVKLAHELLAKAMREVDFLIPMLSEGKTGVSLGALQPHDKKGVVLPFRKKNTPPPAPVSARKAA